LLGERRGKNDVRLHQGTPERGKTENPGDSINNHHLVGRKRYRGGKKRRGAYPKEGKGGKRRQQPIPPRV